MPKMRELRALRLDISLDLSVARRDERFSMEDEAALERMKIKTLESVIRRIDQRIESEEGVMSISPW